MTKVHTYKAHTHWVGNQGEGTRDYKAYSRNHRIEINNKPDLLCSSDPSFRGDPSRHNPEELLVASLSGCHMLWYLHLCAANGVIVVGYLDKAHGVMQENADGSGQFNEVVLSPEVIVRDEAMVEKANLLHGEANKMCFIARSVRFPVHHRPTIRVADPHSV